MASTYTVASGTADGATLTVSNAAVQSSSLISGTLAAGHNGHNLESVDVVAVADGSFTLLARTVSAGGTTSADVAFTYHVRDTDFDASGTLTVGAVTATGAVAAGSVAATGAVAGGTVSAGGHAAYAPYEFLHAITASTQALDAAAYTGFHLDLLANSTLSVTGAVNGRLYTMAVDGDPSVDYTATFGSGFKMASGTAAITHATTAVLVFLGHDGSLNELSRTNPVS